MDRVKKLSRSARNRIAERAAGAPSLSRASGSLNAPHASLPPDDNASTNAVNEGHLGELPGTAVRDYAMAEPAPVEPPTSLQSSVDANAPLPDIPIPRNEGNAQQPASSTRTRARAVSDPSRGGYRPGPGIRQPSIGIYRKAPSGQNLRQVACNNGTGNLQLNQNSRLPTLDENCVLPDNNSARSDPGPDQGKSRWRRPIDFLQERIGMKKKDGETGQQTSMAPAEPQQQYNASMVDVLDTLDPEVQTLTSLTNVQNSLFIPNLGRFVNRRPTYNIRPSPSEVASLEDINQILAPMRTAEDEEGGAPRLQRTETSNTLATVATIDSQLSESRFAVLPHGASLEGWSKEDKKELNDHVRHMLHSRRSKFKRAMRGFGQYVRRPLGFLVTLYATLITLFGLAWVLFLIGWINVGGKQIYVVHIIDSVLVALFAIVGDGLAPFRAVDTYHMIFIAHYHHYTWSRRKKDMLPELHDHNDLPSSNAPISGPLDTSDPEKQWEFTVLTPTQQKKLEHHQKKFSNSHSFYKPHETETHYAFPLRLLVAIVVLLDCHSLFQIALGACTWGIYYKVRPFALTTVILCCSITCNATAGLLIWIGDRRTRKKDVLERMNRQELTEEAMKHVVKKRERESESEREEDGEKKEGRKSFTFIRKGEKDGDGVASPPRKSFTFSRKGEKAEGDGDGVVSPPRKSFTFHRKGEESAVGEKV